MTLNGWLVFAWISVALSFVYDHFEKKRVQDEREELIRLKTAAVGQKLQLAVILLCSAALSWEPTLSPIVPLMALIGSTVYGEILASNYFRRKI